MRCAYLGHPSVPALVAAYAARRLRTSVAARSSIQAAAASLFDFSSNAVSQALSPTFSGLHGRRFLLLPDSALNAMASSAPTSADPS